MGRFEKKFLVPLEKLNELRDAISPFVDKDSFTRDGDNEYSVHSIYYDTRSLENYYEKLSGIQFRKKVRIRGYNEQCDDSYVFLEIKRKNDQIISKNRAPFLFKNIHPLFNTGNIEKYIINGNGSTRVYDDARRFFFQMNRNSLFPIVNIHYNREAYFYKYDASVRITFDKHLRSTPYPDFPQLFKENPVQYSMPESFILEIKYDDSVRGMPVWMQNILGDFGLKKEALSKYCICLDTHRIPQCPRGMTIRGMAS